MNQRGVVDSFDDDRGLGVVVADDHTSYAFHCTAIADGTRTIDAGTPVQFRVVAGHLGQWQATEIEPAATATPAAT